MAKRREMGRDAADPRTHSETTSGQGETTGRQPGHIEPHESPSSAGNEAQVAGILHGSEREAKNDSSSSGRRPEESDAMSHQSTHGQQEHQQGRPQAAKEESGKPPQSSGHGSDKKRNRGAA